VTLFWNQRKHKLTIPLGKDDNVATFQLASGYKKFLAFCAEAELDYRDEQENPIIAEEAQVVSDDESDNEDADREERPTQLGLAQHRSTQPEGDPMWCTPIGADFVLN
jgi:hypothetical protein